MSRSQQLFEQAQRYIPGGVNSPVRAFGSVGGSPLFFERAQGAYLYDVDGKQYIDYVGSWGPMILGHRHPKVIEAVENAIANGLSFGAPCELEVKLAKKICELVPSIDKIRMVNSGTEATMSAIRLARGFTGKNKIIKFEGCYHGHADHLLVKAGSGALTFGHPSSAGVPDDFAKNTLTATFNDLASVRALFENNQADIAAIILEPVPGNMNCILPELEFLQGLRKLCDDYQSLLIFDEVMTGFRVAHNNAQGLFQIKPDLTTFGKIIGGGMPVGAFGGRTEIMDCISPLGPVYQAGTLSGNPVAMAAGLATLELLDDQNIYQQLAQKTQVLMEGIQAAAKNIGIHLNTVTVGSMFGLRFTDQDDIKNFNDITACDLEQFNRFFHGMLQRGIYLAPSAYEAGFVSMMHSEQDIAATIDAATDVLQSLV